MYSPGRGTTHHTNGIIVQRVGTEPEDNINTCDIQLKRTKKRKLDFSTVPIPEYAPTGSRNGPEIDKGTVHTVFWS